MSTATAGAVYEYGYGLSLTSGAAAGGGGGGGDAKYHLLPLQTSSIRSYSQRLPCLRCYTSVAPRIASSTLHPPPQSSSRLLRTLPFGKPVIPSLHRHQGGHHHHISSSSSSSSAAAAAASLRFFTVTEIKWVLQPIGDGDCKHLNEAVPLPEAIELSSDAAILGRVPEKADIVLPIGTVSGVHARLERKGGTLYVTDLGSTNGTYINDRQIKAGAGTPVPPGSRITFGDDHLAAFKFSVVEVEVQAEVEKVEVDSQDLSEEKELLTE